MLFPKSISRFQRGQGNKFILFIALFTISCLVLFHIDPSTTWFLNGRGSSLTDRQKYQSHWPADNNDFDEFVKLGSPESTIRQSCDVLAAVRGKRSPNCSRESLLKGVEKVLNHPRLSDIFETADISSSWCSIAEYVSANTAIFDRNMAKLNRLHQCLGEPDGCPDNAFRVIVGSEYHFYHQAFEKDDGETSGEVVWMRGQMRAWEELGYTFLMIRFYNRLIEVYQDMGDIIQIIFTADEPVMTCQLDPRCIKNMKPTYELFPEFEKARKTGKIPASWKPVDNNQRPQKWIYTQKELDGIPDSEKAGIPLWKLFVLNVWGARNGDCFWEIPKPSNFSYNNLGNEWTISPYNYPLHTRIPFSIEDKCLKTPLGKKKKEDVKEKGRIYVLAKTTEYYYYYNAPPIEAWEYIKEDTGLDIVSSSHITTYDDGAEVLELPDGIENLPRLGPIAFQQELGKSTLMLGIGTPLISPSPYDALCQGTPVVIPIRGTYPTNEWDLYFTYSQHWPVIQLGEPYAYAYNQDDLDDLIDKINKAKNNPIPRYVPPDMTFKHLIETVRWFMEVDWEGFAKYKMKKNGDTYDLHQASVIGRCFEMGRCVPRSER